MRPRLEGLTDEAIMEIIDDMANGESLTKASEKRKFKFKTVWNRIRLSTELYRHYCRARESRADILFEKLEEMEQNTLKGKINPAAFHAVSRSLQWRLGKMKPKDYADKKHVEHSGNINVANEITTSRRQAIIQKVEERQALEAEAVQDADIIEDNDS